jgi:hypothetical protein
VAALRGGELERQAQVGWLEESYFRPGSEGAAWFAVRQTTAVFRYCFGSSAGAAVAFAFFLAGIVHLARRRRPSAILLALPFLLGLGAGLLRLYPYGGTRHSAYLLPFACAAIGVSVAAGGRRRLWLAILTAAVLFPLLFGKPIWSAPRRSLPKMKLAIARIRKAAPPGSLLFADYRTAAVLSYYLGWREHDPERQGPERFWETDTGAYCLVRSQFWTPGPKLLGDEVDRLIKVYRLPPNQRFWVIRQGGEYDLAWELARRFPGSVFPVLPRLGDMSAVEIWP